MKRFVLFNLQIEQVKLQKFFSFSFREKFFLRFDFEKKNQKFIFINNPRMKGKIKKCGIYFKKIFFAQDKLHDLIPDFNNNNLLF